MSVPILLIVEDEAILAMHLMEVLTRQGYRVLKPVATGEEAIQVAQVEQPTIILMDIELGGEITGISAAEQITATMDAAIIFLTGFSQDAMLQKAKLAMPYGYLIKPVSERELIATIEMAIYKHQLDLQIKQSEARYHTLVEQASDGILQADERGVLIEMNPAGQAMLGYTPEELNTINIHQILSFENAAHSRQEIMSGLSKGKQIRCECELLKKSLDFLSVEISGKILQNGTFQAIFRDISERKAAENEARINEIRLRKLVEISQYEAQNLQDLLDFTLNAAIELTESSIGYIYHYDENTQDFTLNSWSKAVMVECTVLEPQTCYQLAKTGLWGEAVRQRKPILDNEYRSPSHLKKGYPEGHIILHKFLTIPIIVNHEIVAVVGVANKKADYNQTDILQLTLLMDSVWKIVKRREAEQAFRMSAEQHQALIHTSLDGFLMLDINGKILKTNQAYCQMSGYSSEELLCLSIFDLKGRNNETETHELIQSVIEKESNQFETKHIRKDGSVLEVEVSSNFIPEQGVLQSFFRDVTARNQGLEALKESEERFKAVSKYSHNAIFLIEESGKIAWVNDAFIAMSGQTKHQIYAAPSFINLIAPESMGFVMQNFSKFLNHEPYEHQYQFYYLRKDGAKRLAEKFMTDYQDRSGKRVLAVSMMDITEKEESRKALEQKTMAYQFLASSALLLPTFTRPEQVFDTIRDSLPQIAPDVFAVLMKTTPDCQYLQVADIQGIDLALIEKGIKKIGVDLRAKKYEIIAPFRQMLSNTKLYEYPDGFEGFVSTEIPKPIARILAKLFSIQGIHMIGLANGGRVYGGLYLFTKSSDQILNSSLIESFMQQCYMALSRIRVQRELNSSQERFQELAENIQETFWLRDRNTGKILYVSPGFERMWGHPCQTLFESPEIFFDTIHPDDIGQMMEAQRELYEEGKFYNREMRLVRPDGSMIWVNARTYPVLNEVGEVHRIAGIAQDITYRKEVEQKHQALEEKFTKAFQTSPDAIAINRLTDGLYMDINEGFQILTGFTVEDVAGKTSLEIDIWVNPDDRQKLLRQLRETGKSENLEADFRMKDGSIKTCLMSANIIEIDGEPCNLSITRDISERKQMEEVLKEREKIFNHSLDMLCMAGFDGYFKVLNPAWEKTLGWSTQELLENPWLTYVHPEDQEPTRQIKSSIVGGQEVFQFENRYICKDGSIKWLSWNSFPYPEEGIMFGVARDVTDRKLIEESLRFSENRYRMLFSEMEEGFALHEIICDEAGKPMDYRFLEVNPAFERQTGLKREDLIGRRVLEVMPEIEEYWIEAYGKVALFDETLHYENFATSLNRWYSVSAFSPKKNHFATTITDVTERKMADELLQNFATELNVAYDATLQGWSNALELREHETAGHSQRVVQQTLRMAQALDVNPHEMIHIERGALLHDIGKMGIPDSILLKPGSLTDDEWQIMRQHPIYAYNLLSKIDYLKPALDIPYCHHEKWDGSGYPRKMKGEAIPLSARIFAIIDVWDALSSNRPYRPAWEKDAIVDYIKNQSGKHFDPQVVDAFLMLLIDDGLLEN